MGTFKFTSVFEYFPTDRDMKFGAQTFWKLAQKTYNASAFIATLLLRSIQKGGLEQTFDCKPYQFTPRESLDGMAPYSIAFKTLDKSILNAFQLRPIASDKVNLTPKLIRFNH